MSKLFFDHLIVFEELEIYIKNNAQTPEEKEELWNLVDGIVQTRILDVVLTKLPRQHHEEFLEKFSNFPHDERLLEYLKEKVADIEAEIKKEVKLLEAEILHERKLKKK